VVVIHTETIGVAARNLARYTENMAESSYWLQSSTASVTGNAAYGPDGTYSLERVNDEAAVEVSLYHDFAVSAGTKYTWSAYVRGDTSPSCAIYLTKLVTAERSALHFNPITGAFKSFTDTGLAGGRYHIERIPGADESGASTSDNLGLWRVQVTLSTTASGTYRVEMAPDDSSPTSQLSTFFGLVQFEQAESATAYQPVTGSTDTYLGTHATIQAWLDATDTDDLATLDRITRGVLLNDEYEIDSTSVDMLNASLGGGGTRDFNRYRELVHGGERVDKTPEAGQHSYRPWDNTGPRIHVKWSESAGNQNGIHIAEDFFRLTGIGLISDWSRQPVAGASDVRALCKVSGSGVVIRNSTAICEEGGGRNWADGPTFYCWWVEGPSAGDLAEDVVFLNCIAKGSLLEKGAAFGFFYDSFSGRTASTAVGTPPHGTWNCAAYDFTRATTPGGIFSVANSANDGLAGPEVINCVAVGSKIVTANDIGGTLSRYANNVSSDNSANVNYLGINGDDNDAPDTHSQVFRHSTAIWASKTSWDLRMKTAGGLRDKGFDDREILSYLFTGAEFSGDEMLYDIDGNPRGGANTWSVGPYESVSSPPTEGATTHVQSIGPGNNRQHFSVESFLNATRNLNLNHLNLIIVGEVHNDDQAVNDIGTTTLLASRTVTDALHYRVLRSAADSATSFNRWNPRLGQGVWIRSAPVGGTEFLMVLNVFEPFFRIEGIKFENSSTSASSRRVLRVTGDAVRVDACEFTMTSGTGSTNIGIQTYSSDAIYSNLLLRGAGNSTNGLTRGIVFSDCVRSGAYHCIAYGMDGNAATGYGFRNGLRADRIRLVNCIGIDSLTDDFIIVAPAVSAAVQESNISSDSSADGPGSQTSVTGASLWVDPANQHFGLKAGSPALNVGANVRDIISTDWNGKTRTSPSDIGIYEGPTFAEAMGADGVRKDLARLATLWRITRMDGTVFVFTDANEPILFEGETFLPSSGVNASARRAESGLKESTVSFDGVIDSAMVTTEDLRAGKFNDARVEEMVIDYDHPFSTPITRRTYWIDRTEYDADAWQTEVVGIANRLERRVGELITVSCPVELGGPRCLADISADTLVGVRIASLGSQIRREFDANSTDVAGSYVDDYFGNGEIRWQTGDNTGLLSVIKSYTSATRSIVLENELPFVIQTSDTFTLKPGCRKRYMLDCVTKFSNGPNYRGHPHIPKATSQLETPRR